MWQAELTQFNRYDPRDPWLYAGDPFRLRLIRVDVRNGGRQVISTALTSDQFRQPLEIGRL